MARARNIKPGFFKNEVLAEMKFVYRLLFIGLWTYADREGRFEYRPRKIKAELFPYEEVNIDDGVAELVDGGFMIIYESQGKQFIQILNWTKHQNPHHKEVESLFPAPEGHVNSVCDGYIPLSNTIRNRIYARDGRVCRGCGATHGLSIDHIQPVSRGGNSVDENLQVLCLTCNSRKGNRIPSNPDKQGMDESCMKDAQVIEDASCPTDSLIPDSLIPDSLKKAFAQQAERFDEFWAEYPRKKGKAEAEKKWKREKYNAIADQIIADVKQRKTMDWDWIRDGGQYIPYGSTYVNNKGWLDEMKQGPPPAEPKKSAGMQAIEKLQGITNGLAQNGNQHRVIEADIARIGMGTGDGFDGRYGGGMDGSIDP